MSLTETPNITAHFELSVDGLSLGGFAQCTGLSSEVGVEEYAEGGENRFTYRFPTRGSSANIVLQRGVNTSTELYRWYSEFERTGMITPRDGLVSLLVPQDGAMAPVRSWAFTRGFPVKYLAPEFDAAASAVAVEAIEILHHGLQRVEVAA